MKRKLIVLISAVALIVGACSNSVENTATTVKVDGGELILGEYKGLQIDKITYKISDSDVDCEIENLLEEYVEYQDVDRGAALGDYVSFDLKSTSNGVEIEDYTGEGYGAYIGKGDFDEEFEEHLVGVTTGEKKEFAITYEEDYPEEVLAGNTVNYEMQINNVEEVTYPELTDAFVQQKLDFEDRDDLRKSTRQRLEDECEENAKYSMKSNLLQQIIDTSTFEKYSDKLYEQCKKKVESEYLTYAEWFDCETVKEVYDSFGMTEEDAEKEILSQVHTRMVVDAIAEKEKIEVSDKEYKAALGEYADTMGYEDENSLLEEFGEDEVRFWVLQDQVIEFVADQAQITEIETEQPQEENWE